MSVDVGLDINTVEYGAYSASGSYKKAQENLVNTTKSIVQVSVEMRMISNMAWLKFVILDYQGIINLGCW